MRWNNNTFGFVLRRMTQLVSDDSRRDKVFNDKDVDHVAKALKKYNGEVVNSTQVYNHNSRVALVTLLQTLKRDALPKSQTSYSSSLTAKTVMQQGFNKP
jgi:hypothetical protein